MYNLYDVWVCSKMVGCHIFAILNRTSVVSFQYSLHAAVEGSCHGGDM